MAKRSRKAQDAVKDWHLWSDVTRTIVPLRPQKPFEMEIDPPVGPAGFAAKPKRIAPSLPSYTPQAQIPIGAHTHIEPGLKRKLARGHLPIDATIDLHGMTQMEAENALLRYIPARAARGDRTLLIITGKGIKKTGFGMLEQKGVLRAMLPRWLAAPTLAPFVAGHEPAARGHGGDGAFYVRLKRVRP